MRPKAVIQIQNITYDLERLSYDFYCEQGLNAKATSGLMGGNIHFVINSRGQDRFLSSLLAKSNHPIESTIEIADVVTGQHIRKLRLHEAYVSHYVEVMHASGTHGMKAYVSLLATRMDINSVEMDRSQYFYHGWVQLPPKPPVAIGTQNAYSPPVPLVTKVTGEKTALPFQKVTYKVANYNLGNVPESDRKRVKWKIAIDDKEQDLSGTGEKIELEVKPEWAGKTISVMPYLKKHTKAVRAETKVRLEAVIVYVNGYWNSGKTDIKTLPLPSEEQWANTRKFFKKLIAENVIGTERKRGYWSGGFISNAERYFKRKYKDWTDKDMDAIQSLFVDGANRWSSSGETRFNGGWAEAELLLNSWLLEKQVIDTQVRQQKLLFVVSHSMGGAHAEGMIAAWKYKGLKIERVLHFSAADNREFHVTLPRQTYQINIVPDPVLMYKNADDALKTNLENFWDMMKRPWLPRPGVLMIRGLLPENYIEVQNSGDIKNHAYTKDEKVWEITPFFNQQ